MKNRKMFGSRPSLGEMFVQHVIVFLICIVFPGALTWTVPATWLHFKRTGEAVSCRASTCLFFVVPYRIQDVDSVTKIGSREVGSRTETQRDFGRTTNRQVTVEGKGFLQVQGVDDSIIEVQVSPASLKAVIEESNDFLNSTTASSKMQFVIANWKFGGLMGGVLTMFTVLYVLGYGMQALKHLLKWFRT